jgi:hypothetical protein
MRGKVTEQSHRKRPRVNQNQSSIRDIAVLFFGHLQLIVSQGFISNRERNRREEEHIMVEGENRSLEKHLLVRNAQSRYSCWKRKSPCSVSACSFLALLHGFPFSYVWLYNHSFMSFEDLSDRPLGIAAHRM